MEGPSIYQTPTLLEITFLSDRCIQFGEGNGTPLQYSCLENPMTGEPGGLQPMGLQKSRK